MAQIDGYHQWGFKTGVLQRDPRWDGFDSNGILIVDEPKRRPGLPFRQIMLFFVAVAAFKIFLFLSMGAATYGSKTETLANGNTVERAAARLMVLDPVSSWLADEIQLLSLR